MDENVVYNAVGQLYINLMGTIQKLTQERNELAVQLSEVGRQTEEVKAENALLRTKIRDLTNGNMGT